MIDRAMQTIQLLALEPIAETTADRISFGFSRYRSPEDAMEYVFRILSRRDSPQWILEGDIKSCFDKISHQWMLEHIPTDKRILKEFMKCGYISIRKTLSNNRRITPRRSYITNVCKHGTRWNGTHDSGCILEK